MAASLILLPALATAVEISEGGADDINPCSHLAPSLSTFRPPGTRVSPQQARLQERMHMTAMTYNGHDRLRAAPTPLLPYPPALRGKGPACFAFRLDVTGSPEQLRFGRPEIIAAHFTDSRSRADFALYAQTATEVLWQLLDSGTLPRPLRPDEFNAILVPLWPPHPLFSGDPALVWAPALSHLGFADARLLSESPQLSLYELGRREQFAPAGDSRRLLLLALRDFAPDEPIIEPGANEQGYGPRTQQWFDRHIAPAIAATPGRTVRVDVLLYARDQLYPPVEVEARFAALNDFLLQSTFPPPTEDPVTGMPVSRALGTLGFLGQRETSDGPLRWARASGSGTQAMTLADMQQQHERGEARRQHLLANAARAQEQAPARYEETQRRYRSAIASEAAAAQARGLVYREPAYWLHFHNDRYFAGILDGSFDRGLELLLGNLYVRYQGWLAGACPQLIPDGAPGIQYDTILRSGFDDPGIHIASEVIRVRPAYWQQFEAFLRQRAEFMDRQARRGAAQWAGGQGAGELGRDMQSTLRESVQITADLRRLFDDNDCDSGLLQQFDDNLYRLAHGQPVLQAEQRSFDYAARDSTRAPARASLASACVEDHLFRFPDRHEGERSDRRRFCRCLDERFATVLNGSEMRAAIDDYTVFDRKINTMPSSSRDPMWRYYGTANACRRQ